MQGIYFHPKIQKNFQEKINNFVVLWNNKAIQTISSTTSGSTGAVKEICLSKKQMKQSALLTGNFFQFKKGQKILLCLSPDYIAGKMMLVRALEWEMDIYVIEPQQKTLDFPQQSAFDFVAMVPLQFKKWLPQINKTVHFKNILLGGAVLPNDLEEIICRHQMPVYLSFGMTETTSHIALRKITPNNKPYVALGKTWFSSNEHHQLIIHSPELNIDSLVSNDVVELLDAHQFYWKGRLDFVINSGGLKFFPEEIERKIASLNWFERFFIFGEEDGHLGQKIAICIESKASKKEKFQSSINNLLSAYERPKSWYFISRFEISASGKILRQATLNRLKTI
jgi:O-succinylbenzoic acid--CoA ligase